MTENESEEEPKQKPTMSFRTELLMEQETAYFYLEKYHDMTKKEDVNVLSDKNFFFELSEYIQSVDHFLFNNICTYHNIVKNSIMKVIDLNSTT